MRLLVILSLLAAGCGGGDSTPADARPCADVVDAVLEQQSDGSWRADVTVRSVETGWESYADAWEVIAPDGSVLARRVLLHPHVEEQPFTRSTTGFDIPGDVTSVSVRAHHTEGAWCGEELEVSL